MFLGFGRGRRNGRTRKRILNILSILFQEPESGALAGSYGTHSQTPNRSPSFEPIGSTQPTRILSSMR